VTEEAEGKHPTDAADPVDALRPARASEANAPCDARPRAIRGIIIALALCLPFWGLVLVLLRLLTGVRR
jgi:hypothetical protein